MSAFTGLAGSLCGLFNRVNTYALIKTTACTLVHATSLTTMDQYTCPEDCFLYFGYGSNLLQERIRIKNPSAKFLTIAKLPDYILGFNYDSPRWKGSVASVFQQPGSHVWGVVWQMNNTDIDSLDDQEGVQAGIYRPMEVQVHTKCGQKLTCRTYELLLLDSTEKTPSPQYLDVILQGARQNHLPSEYVANLEQIKHNGYTGEVHVTSVLAKS